MAWAEQQSALLRRLAAGEPVDKAVDWPRVIEEVQDLELSELRACQSLLTQAMVNLLKLQGWPTSQAARQWRDEVRRFLDDAHDRLSPSTRHRTGLDELYAQALRRVRDVADDSRPSQTTPDACPLTLDTLLADDLDVSLSRSA